MKRVDEKPDHQRNEGHVTDSTAERSADNSAEPMEDKKKNGANIMEINHTRRVRRANSTQGRWRKTCPANTQMVFLK